MLHVLIRIIGVQAIEVLGPVVQSIVSLTSSLRGKLVKCFATLLPNTLKFFVEQNERSSAKASHIFSTKNIGIFEILRAIPDKYQKYVGTHSNRSE